MYFPFLCCVQHLHTASLLSVDTHSLKWFIRWNTIWPIPEGEIETQLSGCWRSLFKRKWQKPKASTLTLEAFYNAKFLNHTTAFARQPLCSTWKLSKCGDELKSSFKSAWLGKYQPRQVVWLQTSSSFKLSDGAHGLRWLWSSSRSLFSESKHSDEKLHIFVKKRRKQSINICRGTSGKRSSHIWFGGQRRAWWDGSQRATMVRNTDASENSILEFHYFGFGLHKFWFMMWAALQPSSKKAMSASNRPHERWHTLTHTGAIQTSHLSSLEMVFLWQHSSCQEVSSSLPTSFLSTAGENSSEKNKGGEWGAGGSKGGGSLQDIPAGKGIKNCLCSAG